MKSTPLPSPAAPARQLVLLPSPGTIASSTPAAAVAAPPENPPGLVLTQTNTSPLAMFCKTKPSQGVMNCNFQNHLNLYTRFQIRDPQAVLYTESLNKKQNKFFKNSKCPNELSVKDIGDSLKGSFTIFLFSLAPRDEVVAAAR